MPMLYYDPRTQVADANGVPYSGAKLYFYETGTSTPLATYSDKALTVANANPVVADSAGRFGPIFLKTQDYKVVLKTSADATIWTQDPVPGGLFDLVDDSTPQLGGTLDANAKQVRLAKGADVASAATLTLGNDGNYFDVTGAVGITAIASKAIGTVVKLHFDAALTISYNPVSLILPGAKAITTVAGDELEFIEFDTGKWVCTGYQTTAGSALLTGKHTIWIPAASMVPQITNGAAIATAESTTNKVMQKVLDFDQATDEYAQFTIAMPKSWDEGTVTAQFLWTATSGAGDVVWVLVGVALTDGDLIDTAFGSGPTTTDTFIGANRSAISPESTAITIGNTPSAGDLIVFQVIRKANAAGDTLNADARLLGVRLFITLNAGNDA